MDIKELMKACQKETSKQIQTICLDLKTLLNILEREFDFIGEKLPWSEQQIRITIEEADDLVAFLISGNEKGNRTQNINLLAILNCLKEKGYPGERVVKAITTIKEFNKKYFSLYEQIYEKIAHSMVIIQDQDIVRQNIENLIKCLGMVAARQEAMTSCGGTELLCSLNFIDKVADISLALSQNVKNRLSQLCGDLVQIFGEINEITVDFIDEAERNQSAAQTENKEFNWLKEIFINISDFVKTNVNQYEENECELIKISEEVAHIYKLLTVTLHNMETKLNKIFTDMGVTWYRMKDNTNFEQVADGICRDINNLKESIGKTKRQISAEFSGQEVPDDKEELKEVLSQFTCLIERKTAQAIWGEEPAEEGETSDIVLF